MNQEGIWRLPQEVFIWEAFKSHALQLGTAYKLLREKGSFTATPSKRREPHVNHSTKLTSEIWKRIFSTRPDDWRRRSAVSISYNPQPHPTHRLRAGSFLWLVPRYPFIDTLTQEGYTWYPFPSLRALGDYVFTEGRILSSSTEKSLKSF